jgi:hypothetical protein
MPSPFQTLAMDTACHLSTFQRNKVGVTAPERTLNLPIMADGTADT